MKLSIPRTFILLLAASMVLCAPGCKKKAPPPKPATSQPSVTINQKTWKVELALTDRQQYQGLSGRTYLGADSGMLFVFENPQVLNFCMRGCYIPLDIAFIDADGVVLKTATMAVEDDHAGRISYSSEKPAQFALEVPAGSLTAANIRAGSKVILSPDIPLPAKAPPRP